eukprot:COSAG01_NODE_13310_length_1603_cov_16.552527_1_plen_308_part_10
MSAGADEPLGEEVMRRLFRGLDLDGSGYLERSEVRTMATMMGVDISEPEVDAAMAQMDTDGDGKIEYAEFSRWWQRTQQEASAGGAGGGEASIAARMGERLGRLRANSDGTNAALEGAILYAFELIDADGDGSLDRDECELAMRKLGERVGEGEAESLFAEIERGPDDRVGFYAFRRWYLAMLQQGRLGGGLGLAQAAATAAERMGGGGMRQVAHRVGTKLRALMMFRGSDSGGGGGGRWGEEGAAANPAEMSPEEWAAWAETVDPWERLFWGNRPRRLTAAKVQREMEVAARRGVGVQVSANSHSDR